MTSRPGARCGHATEDGRFYEDQGVDPLSVLRAVWSSVQVRRYRRGGSTLTQQYVKNVYVDNDQTLYRKVREALISLQIEKGAGQRTRSSRRT